MDVTAEYLFTFIAGLLAGIVLQFVTARKERERRHAVYDVRSLFARFVRMSPFLVEHMRRDLARPEWTRCRRFTIRRSRNVPVPPWFRETLAYFESEHVDLREHVAFLKQVGFVQELDLRESGEFRKEGVFVQEMRPSPVTIFVMTEVFVALMWEANG